jgi:predicted O-methyltransferase YrrM
MAHRLTDSRGSPRAADRERDGSAPGTEIATSVEQLIRDALHSVRDELSALRFIPEHRYDRSTFPTVGQYDWFAGQVLYALVRAVQPRTIIEFSTSSGYSTTFTALALRRNGRGRLHTVDIDARAQAAAANWLSSNEVVGYVEMHTGDCRAVVPGLLHDDVDIVFIDTLHSFEIAEWYFESVIPRLRPDALVHIHDVMPPEARVRIHGGPPYRRETPPARPPLAHLIKRFFWLMLHLKVPNPFPQRPPREMLPLDSLQVNVPATSGELPSIDGNYFEEGVLIRELLAGEHPSAAVYLHRLHGIVDADEPTRYAPRDEIQRTDSFGNPLEWNDALWCRASTLQRVGQREQIRRLVRQLRARHYGVRRASVI